MKNEVQVNGITLTRQQVEQAMRELDKPNPPPVGSIVRNKATYIRGVVVAQHIREMLAQKYPFTKPTDVVVLGLDGAYAGSSYNWPYDSVEEI